MKVKIVAYTLCLLSLGANIVLYYYQRHRFIEIITAWKKQDATIAHKAWLYDVDRKENVWRKNGQQNRNRYGKLFRDIAATLYRQ